MTIIRELTNLIRLVWLHPANRQARVAALLRLLRWQLRKRILREAMIVPVFSSRRFKVVPDSKFSSLVYYNAGLPDWDEMNFLLRTLRGSDGFLDIGANVGYYTVLASTRVPPEAIWAVEAHPENVKVLTEQLRLNRLEAVSVLSCALGAMSGQVRFSAEARETGSVTERSDASTFVVEMCTLDSWLGPRARPPVIFAKIDVEGSELEVLAGASGLLGAGAVAVWLFELSAPNLARHGRTAADLVGCFARHGYDFYLWNESDRTIEAVNPLEHTEANFIACRRPLTWLKERLGI